MKKSFIKQCKSKLEIQVFALNNQDTKFTNYSFCCFKDHLLIRDYPAFFKVSFFRVDWGILRCFKKNATCHFFWEMSALGPFCVLSFDTGRRPKTFGNTFIVVCSNGLIFYEFLFVVRLLGIIHITISKNTSEQQRELIKRKFHSSEIFENENRSSKSSKCQTNFFMSN